MYATPQRLLLTLIGWGVLHAAPAQVKPAPFAPACDLQELNRAYVASLNRLRHQLDPHSPIVVFDPALLVGTMLHSAKMEAADSMFHAFLADAPFSAELVGTKRLMQEQEAKKIAQFALNQFEGSERHCILQETSKYVYVAICSGKNFYIVRLSDKPGVTDKEGKVVLQKLGIKELVRQEEVKPAHRLIYRAF